MFTETQRLILGIWFTLSSSCLFFPFLANNFLPTDIAMSFIFSNIFSFSLLIGCINLLLEIVIIPFIIIRNKIKRRKELIKRTKESLIANNMTVEQSNIEITKDNNSIKETISIKETTSIKEAEKVIKESKIELSSLNHSTNSYLMKRKNHLQTPLRKPLQKELKDTIAEENKLKDEIQTEMKNLSGTLERLKALNKSLNESLDKNNKHVTHTFDDESTRVYSKRNK